MDNEKLNENKLFKASCVYTVDYKVSTKNRNFRYVTAFNLEMGNQFQKVHPICPSYTGTASMWYS